VRGERIKFLFLPGLITILASVLQASESPTRSEFEELVGRIERLEAIFATLQIDINQELNSNQTSTPQTKGKANTSILENVINVIQSREDNVNYPWMNSQLWESLKAGMTLKNVESILGRPTLDEPSLHKRIDTVYTYKGKQAYTGNMIKGTIRFYRSKLTEIEPPEFN